MAYVAIGIIGATVMPHNLYLHSALVQSRRIAKDKNGIRQAIKFNTLDSDCIAFHRIFGECRDSGPRGDGLLR